MTRRDFLVGGAATMLLPLSLEPAKRRPLKFAVITDLHHGLAPDALSRLQAFCEEVRRRSDLRFVMQMGDFNYSMPDSAECTKMFLDLPYPKIHVLGNHDMDKCDKDTPVRLWGMKKRYGSTIFGDYKFVVLDLNHFKKDGQILPYSHGNYFQDGITCNWADPEQLRWLENELLNSAKPVILISHQPLGFAEPGQQIPPEQLQILDIVSEAKALNPRGTVALSMFGHLHVDRLEHVDGIPYYCVNSASYFWGGGMYPYSKPLFAFMELTSDGFLKVEGVESEFLKKPPSATDGVLGRSASIIDRHVSVS
ncbi:MAG TPA: metallophosphoesterase [Fimbriimonas sp.]|nr:metallophosphoesterase [Fimbriimonas sp.]